MGKITALLVLGALLATLGAGAGAQTAGTFLSFSSDPGDYIGGGQSRYFTPDTAAFQARADDTNRYVNVTVFPFDGGFWYLDLAAPQGQQLVPGVYEGAARYPFQSPSQPGLSFVGDGRGCNTVTGRFQVLEALYGPLGYVERFHATFEQHCEGGEPALRGEVQIVNPPPPPPLAVTLTVNPTAAINRITGAVIVTGTVACSAETAASVFGILQQRASRYLLSRGSFGLSIACAPAARPWSAEIQAESGPPFNPGTAQLDVSAQAFDPNYGIFVTRQVRAVVKITTARR